MNAFTKLGLVIVLVGAIALAGPIFGFSTIAADRGMTVTTADDSNAFVGINATGETPDNKNDAVVVEITNNADEPYNSLETDVTLDDDNGALAISSGFNNTLSAGETTGLELTCDGGGDGTATVSVSADAFGSMLQVEGVNHRTSFSYSCTGHGSNANLEVQNVELGDDTDELELVLENTGEEQAKIHGVSIDETTSQATEVENDSTGNPPPVDVGGTETKATAVSINGDEHDLQGKVEVGAGDTVSVGIYGFQDNSGTSISIAGEDVTISLYGANQRLEQITVSVPE